MIPSYLSGYSNVVARFWVSRIGWVGSVPASPTAQTPFGWSAPVGTHIPTLTYRVQFLADGFPVTDVSSAAGFPCTGFLSSSSQSFAANGGPGTVNVALGTGCNLTGSSNDSWITITSGSGTGNGTVSYSVAQNTTSTIRTGTITVAGRTYTVYQGAQFNDVPVGAPFYAEIGKLSARGITLGCGGGNYCPNDPVLREQMAAFIIRALGDFNPPLPPSQRFNDVPPSNLFYAFIDQMAARQITVGCGGANYCPSQPVSREQMAAFLLRALGEFNPAIPPTQRFNDVPQTNQFYNFIDRLATLQITLGCSTNPPLYCPADQVTRAQMAAFLVRAFNL